MRMPIYFRQILVVCLTLSLQYPVTAQPTDSATEEFKFCMSTCTSNSCSGPASVVEKNCSRKCSINTKATNHIATNSSGMCSLGKLWTPTLNLQNWKNLATAGLTLTRQNWKTVIGHWPQLTITGSAAKSESHHRSKQNPDRAYRRVQHSWRWTFPSPRNTQTAKHHLSTPETRYQK